jgi:hypothetical protein
MLVTQLLTSAMSGSMGGVTAATNRGGQYFRKRSIPTNPRSPAQHTVRTIFGGSASTWQRIGSANQAAWNAYGASVTRINRLGVPRNLSGFNWFQGVTNYLNLFGAGANFTAPPPGTLVPAPSYLSAPSFSGGFWNVDIVPPATGWVGTGSFLLMFMSVPVSIGAQAQQKSRKYAGDVLVSYSTIYDPVSFTFSDPFPQRMSGSPIVFSVLYLELDPTLGWNMYAPFATIVSNEP